MSLSFLLKSFEAEDKAKAKSGKDEISLAGILQRKQLALYKQVGPRKASPYFSPSTISYGFCMREKVAQLAGYHEIWIKHPTPKEQLIFNVGNHYHDIVQGDLWDIGVLEGWFRCLVCKFEGYGLSPTSCQLCKAGRKYLEYREVPFFDKEYQIRGRADGILHLEVAKNVIDKQVVDIKSISNKGPVDIPQSLHRHFEDLDELGPPEPHVIQLMIYLRQLQINTGHLLYVAKNTQQRKSFQITYSEKHLQPCLDDIRKAIDWANDLKAGNRIDLPDPCSKAKCECEQIVRPGISSKDDE